MTDAPMPLMEHSDAILLDTACSSGWKKLLLDAHQFRDITAEGIITLSSCAPGFGVKELLHDSADRLWKSNRSLPHRIIFEFQKKVFISYVMIYLDYATDESYCPSNLRIEMGWSTNDIFIAFEAIYEKPQGWLKIDIREELTFNPRRVMMVQVTVLGNHEAGRDCSIRHLRLIGPVRQPLDTINRFVFGRGRESDQIFSPRFLPKRIDLANLVRDLPYSVR